MAGDEDREDQPWPILDQEEWKRMIGEEFQDPVLRPLPFRPCADCLTPITCEESDEEPRCP